MSKRKILSRPVDQAGLTRVFHAHDEVPGQAIPTVSTTAQTLGKFTQHAIERRFLPLDLAHDGVLLTRLSNCRCSSNARRRRARRTPHTMAATVTTASVANKRLVSGANGIVPRTSQLGPHHQIATTSTISSTDHSSVESLSKPLALLPCALAWLCADCARDNPGTQRLSFDMKVDHMSLYPSSLLMMSVVSASLESPLSGVTPSPVPTALMQGPSRVGATFGSVAERGFPNPPLAAAPHWPTASRRCRAEIALG